MRALRLWKLLVIGGILIASLTGCGTLAGETLAPEPTITQIPPTYTPLSPTNIPKPISCEAIEGVCLELIFDGESCLYEGPTSIMTVPITLIFRNDSDRAATTNMIRLKGDKTIQDLIEYNGEEPSQTHHPSWSVEIPGVWRTTGPGESHVWEGVLEPGIHAVVCFSCCPGGVWFGSGFSVEDG
jgi:hypothetical protein